MIRFAVRFPLLFALLLAGAAVAKDRHDRPPASRLFISPMGEPFRSDLDGDPEAAWFAGADTDHDGRISLAEFQADAARWFAVIDRAHDGEIDPDDIDYYENRLVPEIRVADAPRSSAPRSDDKPQGRGRRQGGRGGGMGGGHRGGSQSADSAGQDAGRTPVVRATRQGAARYSYLDFPEPLTAADANLNRGVDRAEMARAAAERFALLDKNGDGYLERRELPRVDTRTTGPLQHLHGPERDAPPPSDRDRQLGGGDREQE